MELVQHKEFIAIPNAVQSEWLIRQMKLFSRCVMVHALHKLPVRVPMHAKRRANELVAITIAVTSGRWCRPQKH